MATDTTPAGTFPPADEEGAQQTVAADAQAQPPETPPPAPAQEDPPKIEEQPQGAQSEEPAPLPPEHLRAKLGGGPEAVAEDDSKGKTPEQLRAEANAEMDKLRPDLDGKVWILGKPPEKGGKNGEWARYDQKELGYFARMRFFALLAGAIGKALEGEQTVEDLLKDAGVVQQRGAGNISLGNLSATDLSDLSGVLPVVFRLLEASPDFLLHAYCILLNIPGTQRPWARVIMEQRYDPDDDQWGLTDDQGIEIIQLAIAQNYEPIREFFTGKLPRIAAVARAQEAVRDSDSAQ